jgi:predicted nuclease with TOPRIM domain
MVHPYDYNSLLDKYNKLQEKYDDIFKHLEEMTDKYDVLLKEKLDLESYNSRLKDDVSRLKDDLEGATAHISSMSRNREDMFVLIKSVLCKMEENKMNDLTMFIDGVSVDIHKQTGVYKGRPVPGTYAIRTREA